MGKKKGGNKLSRMSDEERRAHLQHKSDMEEEARRRKQQLIALYMKNKLKREDTFTRLNLAKINQEWRSILRQLKCDELKDDIRNAEELCKSGIGRKNAVINRLLSDLDESEEMYSTMLQSHYENIEKLLQIHKERQKFWSNWYSTERDLMLKRFRGEIDNHNHAADVSKADLECLYFALEGEIAVEQSKTKINSQTRLDRFRNMMTIRLEDVTKQREAVMESLWREFQMVLMSYVAYTKEFYDEYVDIKRKDELETQFIQSHYQEVTKYSNIIVDLRLELNSIRSNYQLNRKHLMDVKTEYQRRYAKVKGLLEEALKKDKENTRRLVICSTGALKALAGWHKKLCSLTQLATICRKYEGLNEKLHLQQQPGRISMDSSVKFQDSMALSQSQDFQTNTYNNLSKMEHFWTRYNKVRLDCVCLLAEKSNRIEENARLKSRLKRYLVDVAIRNDSTAVESGARRPKSMTIEKVKVECIDLTDMRKSSGRSDLYRRRPITCTEGNLSVAVRSHKILEHKFVSRNFY